jgi:hypothetical protein
VDGWVRPPPLDVVTLQMQDGTRRDGGLLAQAEGLIYTAGRDGAVLATPLSEVREIEVRDGEPRYWKSLAEHAGVPVNLDGLDFAPFDWLEAPFDWLD